MDSILSVQNKDSSSRHTSQKSFTLTLHWNLEKTCEDQAWNHSTSTHRSETNGIAEIAIRREKEGTSAVLLQSGLDERWWSDSLDFCCHLRNVQDLLADGKTPDDRRFGEPFMKGPIIPFGAMAESPVFTTRSMKTSSIWQDIVKLVSFLAMS